MPKAWKKLDLQGNGLQSLQIQLAKLQKKPFVAYGLWLLFPLGLHRLYLGDGLFWLYPLASAATVALWWVGLPLPTLGLALLVLVFAVLDLIRIPEQIRAMNKELRKQLWLRKDSPGAPKDFKGPYGDDEGPTGRWHGDLKRYTDLKEQERAGHQADGTGSAKGDFGPGRRAPSFAEQERLLREMAKRHVAKEGTGQKPGP